MEEYDKGPVTSCFAHISNHSDHAIKAVFLFWTLALTSLGMLKAGSVPWEERTRLEPKETGAETQTWVECPKPVGLAEGHEEPHLSWGFKSVLSDLVSS